MISERNQEWQPRKADSQSGATETVGSISWPRVMREPEMIESLALPRTPTEPNRYFREASRRLKKPPIWLDDMKTWVNSSLYLKSIRQTEKPSLSNLILSISAQHVVTSRAHFS